MNRTRFSVLRRPAAAIAAVLVAASLEAAPARNFLWKATSKSGGTMYLVGSVHLLAKDSYPLNPALETASARHPTAATDQRGIHGPEAIEDFRSGRAVRAAVAVERAACDARQTG
jgi:hypothetical protein